MGQLLDSGWVSLTLLTTQGVDSSLIFWAKQEPAEKGKRIPKQQQQEESPTCLTVCMHALSGLCQA